MEKEQLLIEKVKEEIIEKIKKLEAKENKAAKVVEETRVKVLRNNELVLKKRKVYIPKDESLRLEMI